MFTCLAVFVNEQLKIPLHKEKTQPKVHENQKLMTESLMRKMLYLLKRYYCLTMIKSDIQ